MALAGCSLPSLKVISPPKPTDAWVRLDYLVTLHPLAIEAPSKMPQQPSVTLTQQTQGVGLTKPDLPRTAGWEQAQRRRLQGRVALQEADRAGIQEFGERLQRRQARFLEISRAQFEVQERLLTAGKAQEDREEAQRSVSEQVAALNDDLSLAQTQYQVSRALASPANDSLLAPDEPEKVAAEVARLKAAKLRAEIQVDPLGVRRAKVLWQEGGPPRNARVLYAASRDALKVLCDALEAQVARAELLAEAKRQKKADEREIEVGQRVAQRLEGIRSRDETFLLRLDQEEGLSRILLAEELPTRRAAGSQRTASLSPSVSVNMNRKGTLPTVQPKESAPSALEAEIRAVVQDVARRRGIRVSFSPRSGVPDRTTEFAQWIKVRLQ